MKIRHCWGGDEIKKESAEPVGFLLTNRLGGYLSLPNKDVSRYNGWFFTCPDLIGKKIFKIIENIELLDSGEVIEIKNNFWSVERNYAQNREKFFLPKNHNSLVYELDKKGKIELFLDLKESYDNQEFGRFYQVSEEQDVIVIKCQNNQDIFYLAIKTDKLNYSEIGDWVFRNHQLDKKRGSYPLERYVYKAISISSQKIVFSVDSNKEKAIKEAKQVFAKIKALKKAEQSEQSQTLSKTQRSGVRPHYVGLSTKEIDFAYLSAQNSLNSLVVSAIYSQNSKAGLYAGLPWFFQFWSRDELISLKPLNKKVQKDILLRQFNEIKKIYDLDSLGWLFYRAGEMLDDKEIKSFFLKFIDRFEILDAVLTWMDTLSRPKGIDLYALKLQMYKKAYQASGDLKFLEKEKLLLKYVRKNFWNRKFLADTPNNFIKRPNLFLVAYIYPELLSKKEWTICFENILPKLWLEWGGIATVDKTSDLFVSKNTGEDPSSYHNGDSWFWVNNLAALVLARLDKKRFKKYIAKILEASTNEILWKGVIGHHTEISSANKFKSEGCWAQAWSSALYIELIDYLISVGDKFRLN